MDTQTIDEMLAGKALISVAEAAKIMSVTRQHLYNCIARDEVPSVKVGGCVRVPTSFIKELVNP